MKSKTHSAIFCLVAIKWVWLMTIFPFLDLNAQQPDGWDDLSPEEKPCLFRPRPFPECRTFLITELGYYYRLNPTPHTTVAVQGIQYEALHRRQEARSHFTSDLGLMRNFHPKYALGVGHFFSWNSDSSFRGGFKARFRTWFSPKLSMDVAPGIYLYERENLIELPSFMGSVQLNVGNTFAFSVMVERLHYNSINFYPGVGDPIPTDPWQEWHVQLGLKAGSNTGKIGHLVVVGGGLFLAMLCVAAGCGG